MKRYLPINYLLLACLVLGLMCGLLIKAQGVDERKITAPVKIDEYSLLGNNCDYGARLDNFAILLEKHPEAFGYIISYGTEASGKFLADGSELYLKNARGIKDERIKTIYGGYYKTLHESASELWLVPFNAELPQPKKYTNDVNTFNGRFIEYKGWDGFYDTDPNGISPGNVKLSGFIDLLKHQPQTIAYIVAFQGKDAAPGAWRRLAKRDVEEIVSSGINKNRVKIIYGGYRSELFLQWWVLPKDKALPVVATKFERRPKEAVGIGSFEDYTLKYPFNEKWVFEGFADVLQADKQLRALIIVHPRIKPLEKSFQDEPPEIDLKQLAERWRTALVENYGMSESRMIVKVIKAKDELDEGKVEVWIVPSGKSLPRIK